jgi:hypothetical protein
VIGGGGIVIRERVSSTPCAAKSSLQSKVASDFGSVCRLDPGKSHGNGIGYPFCILFSMLISSQRPNVFERHGV